MANPADVSLIAPADRGIPQRFWHRKLLAGRLPDPDRADEVDVSFPGAQLHHGTPLPLADHVFVRFRPGAGAAALARLARQLTAVGPYAVRGPTTPADVVNFGQVQNLPLVLGGCFGVLALMTIAHLLVTSVRR